MSYLPVAALSRSQRIRLGRGLGDSRVVDTLALGDLGIHPQSGKIIAPFYANLNDPNVRKDLQHHTTLGALIAVGPLSTTVTSDFFSPSAATRPAVAAGTGLTVSSPSFTLQGRTFGGVINTVNAVNLVVQPNNSTVVRTDAVVTDAAGNQTVVTGLPNEAGQTEVDSVATTGTPTAGTFTLSGTVNTIAGTALPFTTAAIAYNATAAAVATAVQNAIQSVTDQAVTVTGSGGALPTAVSLSTAGVALTALSANSAGMTGGTATFTQTTVGQLGAPFIGGMMQVVATFQVTPGATAIGSINTVIPTS